MSLVLLFQGSLEGLPPTLPPDFGEAYARGDDAIRAPFDLSFAQGYDAGGYDEGAYELVQPGTATGRSRWEAPFVAAEGYDGGGYDEGPYDSVSTGEAYDAGGYDEGPYDGGSTPVTGNASGVQAISAPRPGKTRVH